MTQVVFSFDTEDYTNPAADGAIKRLADILASHGVRGCFNVVGELACELERRGRRDVINALAAHEVDFHSWRHSWHPVLVEYGDAEDWQAGYRRFFEEESKGARAVRRIFGRDRLFAAVPPGNSIAAQAPYVYNDLGIPVYSGSLFKGTRGKSIWYCNQLNLENNLYLDDILWGEGADSFLRRADEYLGYERVIVCMHPNMSVCGEFWDALNVNGENRVPFGQWRLPAMRDAAESERFFAGFSRVVDYFATTPGYEMVCYEDIWRAQAARHPLTLQRLLALLRQTEERFFFAEDGGEAFSLAELFEGCVHFLRGGQDGFTPTGWKGFWQAPAAVDTGATVSAEALRRAAEGLHGGDVVPAAVEVGAAKIGPADFLRGARAVLEGAREAVLAPGPALPDTKDFYRFDDFRLKGTWMYSEHFEDRFTTDRLRWQSLTIRT